MQRNREGHPATTLEASPPRRSAFPWSEFGSDNDKDIENARGRQSLAIGQDRRRALSATAAEPKHRDSLYLAGILPQERGSDWQEGGASENSHTTRPGNHTRQNTWIRSAQQQDMTIHFDMDVAEDVDSLLEEFSRLKRLGDFCSAEQHFRDYLEIYADMLPVIIEYADMLVEQGSYSRLNQFISSQRTVISKQAAAIDMQSNTAMYLANLNLIEAFSAMHSRGLLVGAYNVVQHVGTELRSILRAVPEPTPQLDSAQIQIIRYALRILSHIERETDIVPANHFDQWSNWAHLYKALVYQGRVWDVRDILLASLQSDGARNTWGMIFKDDVTSPSAFNQLFADWNIAYYDESTYLAVLDIVVAVGLALCQYCFNVPDKTDILFAQRCLQPARGLALCLKENNPDLKKSRSYLQWVLAEGELQRKSISGPTVLQAKLNTYPGLTVWPDSLPIYVPIKGEVPEDCRAPDKTDEDASTAYDEIIVTVLDVVRGAGDYVTEALCLKELIYRSSDLMQRECLARMRYLQKDLQGDLFGYQQTVLSSLLFARRTERARFKLYSELDSLRYDTPRRSTIGLSAWCAVMIERALCLSLNIDTSLPQLHDEAFVYLPQYIKDHLNHAGLVTVYGLKPGTDVTRGLGDIDEYSAAIPQDGDSHRLPVSAYASNNDTRGREKEAKPLSRAREGRRLSYERIRANIVSHEGSDENIHAEASEPRRQMLVKGNMPTYSSTANTPVESEDHKRE
ncbi:uncharacterized protein BDV14DRAFT_195186 [Aspergillus stella-maris]|uniref:uncharacterized protein n=1 Tax=Aspergillus stella-maris TaxID=1810926 RepID=UPI003CCD6E4E